MIHESLAKPISIEEAKSLNFDDFIIIDTRSEGYYLISHLKNAINVENIQRIGYIAQENPDKKILLYCHSGHGVSLIGTELVKQGLENIYYVDGNFFAFIKAGAPEEKGY